MKPPKLADARRAPELPLLAAADAALAALQLCLVALHPTLVDLEPNDPPTVAAARALLDALLTVRQRAHRYRRIVARGARTRPPDPLDAIF